MDPRRSRALWSELTLTGGCETFRPALVENLPEPARRFLLRAIQPGTPLARSVELRMHGEIRLDPDRDPLPMRAEQILAPPEGFIWRASVAKGLLRIRGFDRYAHGEGETHWKLWGLVPVARATGRDVTRSAAGRLAMEAIMLPSSLVPGRGAAWEAVDSAGTGTEADRARFRMTVGEETVTTALEVDLEGRPVRATALRWTEKAGPGGAGYSPFGVELEGELTSGGYRIPSRIAAGWRLGQEDEFRFFEATLDRAVFR